ncbi:MAG: discoidin domain-containing protein [Nanoarchaeota archaeon]|nr:discoidin domain-containing protein [Nanoarchaeota archaeon]
MFKKSFILITILLFMGSVSSADYLTADPQSGDAVKKYRIELNGEILDADIRTAGENQVQLYYNVDHLLDGKYLVSASSGNETEWSEWSESFEFYRGIPTPQNIYLFCGIEEVEEPVKLSQVAFEIAYVSSEDTDNNRFAYLAIDGDVTTFWRGTKAPHEIQIDLGATYTVSGFYYLARQDTLWTGAIKKFAFYGSLDGNSWEELSTGELMKIRDEQLIEFPAQVVRYVRLLSLSEVDGGTNATISELNILGY